MKYTALIQGERLEIEFQRNVNGNIQARIGDRTYSLEASELEPGVYWLNWNGHSIEVTITTANEGYTAAIGARHIPVEILDARAALKKAAQHGHDGVMELRAPMPGKIVKTLVAEGATVSNHEGIIVMEAMKMQNEIKSPKNGVVRRLAVAEGATVNSGDLLALIE